MICLTHCSTLFSQQTALYSNYLFNNYGLNPAYLSKSSCLEVKVGRREQWVGFPNAPLSMFIGMSNKVGKKMFRNYWHGIGFYLEQEKYDVYKADAGYFSYSYHLKVSHNYFASFGTFVGAKMHGMSPNIQDITDPAFQFSGTVLVVPDISMGARLYSKTNFFDFSVRQVYKNKVNLGGKKIGTPSKITPHINFIAGRRIESSAYYYSYVPSMNVRWTLLSPPSVDLSFMFFIKKQYGFGLSYRYNDAVIALVQYNYKNLISIALAYDYVLSKMRVGASGSREVMLGFSSCPPGQEVERKSGCPAYDR